MEIAIRLTFMVKPYLDKSDHFQQIPGHTGAEEVGYNQDSFLSRMNYKNRREERGIQ